METDTECLDDFSPRFHHTYHCLMTFYLAYYVLLVSADVSRSNLGRLLRKSTGITVPNRSSATATRTGLPSASSAPATAAPACQNHSVSEANEPIDLRQLSVDFLTLQRRSVDQPEVRRAGRRAGGCPLGRQAARQRLGLVGRNAGRHAGRWAAMHHILHFFIPFPFLPCTLCFCDIVDCSLFYQRHSSPSLSPHRQVGNANY